MLKISYENIYFVLCFQKLDDESNANIGANHIA